MEQNEQTLQIDWDNIPNMAYTKAYSLKYGDDEEQTFTKSKTWMKLIKALANKLIAEYPEVDLAQLTMPGSNDYFCFDDKSFVNWPIDLDNNMYFEGNLSAVKAVALAADMIKYFNADKTKIVIKYLGKDAVAPEVKFEDNFRRQGEAGKLKMIMELCGELSADGKNELAEWLKK